MDRPFLSPSSVSETPVTVAGLGQLEGMLCMAEDTEPSFGKLVGLRAWWAAWKFFEDVRHDIALGAIAIFLAAYQQYTSHGLSVSLRGAGEAVVAFLLPFVIVWLLLFIWHLWLAPAALAYEAMRKAAHDAATVIAQRASAPAKGVREPPKVNWAVWRLMDSYTLKEFSSILVKRDPKAGGNTNEEYSFQQLVGAQIIKGNVLGARLVRYSFSPYDVDPDDTTVTRLGGIAWAEANNFDVSHIK